MQKSEQPFKEYWTQTIWPALQTDYARLLKTTPKRIAERVEKDRAEKNKKDKEPEGKTARRKEKESSSGEARKGHRGGEGEGRAQECLHELGVDRAD